MLYTLLKLWNFKFLSSHFTLRRGAKCSADCKRGVVGFKLRSALINYITWAALFSKSHWTVSFHSKNWFASLLLLGSRLASLVFCFLCCRDRFVMLVEGLCLDLRFVFLGEGSLDLIINSSVLAKNYFVILVPRLAAPEYEYYASSDDG
jgi:hypothetical protein